MQRETREAVQEPWKVKRMERDLPNLTHDTVEDLNQAAELRRVRDPGIIHQIPLQLRSRKNQLE